MTTFTTLLLALSLAGSGESKEPSASDSIVRVYDLRSVTPVFDSGESWSQRLMMYPSDRGEDVEQVDIDKLYEPASTDIIVDLIGQVFGDELRYEGREISLTGDSKLVVLAPESVHERVNNLLGMLERIIASEIEISVDIIELDKDAPAPQGGLIDAAEGERLLAGYQRNSASLASYELRLRAGRTTSLDLTRNTSYLADYDVEIATGATVFDPVIGVIEEGMRLFLRGVPTDDGLFLTVVYNEAALIEPIELETLRVSGKVWNDKGVHVIDEALQVQKPRSFQRAMAFDTFVPTGKAIVAYSECQSGGQSSRQVILIRHRGGELTSFHDLAIEGTTRRLLAVNTELFNPPRLSIGGPWADAPRNGTFHDVFMFARVTAEPSLFFFDWIKHRFSVWRRMGPWALAVTDPSWDDSAAKELGNLVANWSPETRVTQAEARLHRRSGEGGQPVRWSAPVRAGSGCAARIGMVSIVLADYDVEVAQAAGMRDPVLYPVFDGLAVGMAASRGANGSLSVDVRGMGQVMDGGLRRLETSGSSANLFDQPIFDRLYINDRLNLFSSDGEPLRVRLGDSGLSGKGLQLEITLR